MAKISVIIPAFNEARTVGSLIQITTLWPQVGEVIVVNDGSKDDTEGQVVRFGKQVRYIAFPKNRGQGAALAKGVETAKNDIILFIDADVCSVSHADLDLIVDPLINKKADMAIAILNYWKAGSFEPFSDVSGTRAVFRKNLLKHIHEIERSKYGVTVCINTIHNNLRVQHVRVPHMYVLGKFDKQSVPEAMQAYIREASELVMQALRDQVGGRLTPPTRKVFRTVQGYLSKALEFIQQ
jgi:polyisoprenyl-phosphate glycosyltransferase